MDGFNSIAVRVLSGFLLIFAFFSLDSFSEAKAQSTLDPSAAADEKIPPSLQAPAKRTAQALPAPTPGETLVYFFPTDNDATATVIYLLNTDSVAHVVPLRGFSYNGVLVYSLNININATSIQRLISDSPVSSPPPSWCGPPTSGCSGINPIITNFTDFTYFASLSLPRGVVADGYTIFNPGTGVVDPRADQGAIKLRFMTVLPQPTPLN
jgi:hypothetical protein